MEQTHGNWGHNSFRFSELCVNSTTSTIFDPWEACKMKNYNLLTVEAKVFVTEWVPSVRAYPVFCEGPLSCLLFSFLVLFPYSLPTL